MTIARQLTLTLIKEIIAGKRNNHISPDYALRTELDTIISDALDTLVSDGTITRHSASINRIPAYSLPTHRNT